MIFFHTYVLDKVRLRFLLLGTSSTLNRNYERNRFDNGIVHSRR